MAGRLGTSPARLSQVENERTRLDLEEVLQVADALDVSLDALLSPDVALPYQIRRDADARARWPQPSRLATPHGSGSFTPPHQYRPLANLFVGRHLEPHCFRSLEPEPAESLHVFCSPSASTDSGLDWTQSRAIAHTGNGGSNLHGQIGEKMMLLREEHGWTLERVARSAGLSRRHMIEIERGDRAIPLDAVLNLARAFERPLRELIGLAVGRRRYHVVQRSKDIASIPSRRRRTPVERPHATPSKTCALTTCAGDGQVRETLRAGDSCYIDSTVPHLLRRWTRNPYSETSAEVLDVFWCPLGEAYLFEAEGRTEDWEART